MKLMKIESILCPTDLSPDSDEALRYAVALSRAYNAELILLHCDTSEASTEVDAHDAAAEKIKLALVRYSGDANLNSLEWKSVVITSDDVGEAITRQAAILKVDLIVMRSRRRPHRAALLGSTAESVSRTAPCPVLVMHSDERDWVTGSETKIDLKRVLVAYDFSDHSELALNSALSFAQEYQSELHLLHVLPPFSVNESEISWYPLGREGAYHQAARRLQKAAPPKHISGAKLSTRSAKGSLIARYSTMRKRTRLISSVWARMEPALECARCLDRMSIESCVRLLVPSW